MTTNGICDHSEGRLTNLFVRAAKSIDAKLTEYADSKETGLALRITPAGVKSWTYRYRLKSGQQKRVSLGKTRDVSLADARALVVKYRANVADGGDPAAATAKFRQDAKDQPGRETVNDIGKWYFRECEAGRHRPNVRHPKRPATINQERYFFDKHLVPAFGKQKLTALTRSQIQAFIDSLADGYSISTARKCRVVLHAIFAFSQRHEIVNVNPCRFVTVITQKARERVLTDSELRTVWEALTPPVDISGASISASVAYSILLAMVTLQRRAEITGIRIDEIDWDRKVWTIPSSRTKNHRTHVVLISNLAMELIDAATSLNSPDGNFVFPSPRTDIDKPIDPNAMTRAFGRMKNALSLSDIRPHDLRRTGATNLTGERLGFPRFIVSRVLNHVSDTGGAAAVTGVYDQNEYLPEKRRALDAWANRLLEIVGERGPGSNVVVLTR